MSRKIDTTGKTGLSAEQEAAAQGGGKLLFTDYHGQSAAFLIRENRLRAACLFPRVRSKIGAVYLGRVKNVVQNLNACFVEIGGEEREICFLSGRDAAYPFLLNRAYDGRILEGDELLVQVVRDAVRTKQASVTTLISLANAYFALSVGNPRTGFSNKLTAGQKEQIRQLLLDGGWKKPRIVPPKEGRDSRAAGLPTGLVVRTRAAELLEAADSFPEEGDGSLFLTELHRLTERWEDLFRSAVHCTCFSCLLDAPAPWEAALEQLAYPYEYDEILTNDRELYEQFQVSGNIPAGKPVRFYGEAQDVEFPLAKLYSLETRMETALSRRVWLKSGGYLVIDPTEALTVIDVNSGKCEAGKAAEETYYRVNREAAEEIALQLRLRNLSGMIVVDFISMESKERQSELLEYLRRLVRTDRQKTVVVDMTPLGLVEITRKKGSRPLSEQIETKT